LPGTFLKQGDLMQPLIQHTAALWNRLFGQDTIVNLFPFEKPASYPSGTGERTIGKMLDRRGFLFDFFWLTANQPFYLAPWDTGVAGIAGGRPSSNSSWLLKANFRPIQSIRTTAPHAAVTQSFGSMPDCSFGMSGSREFGGIPAGNSAGVRRRSFRSSHPAVK
jgi:hypothetical protein